MVSLDDYVTIGLMNVVHHYYTLYAIWVFDIIFLCDRKITLDLKNSSDFAIRSFNSNEVVIVFYDVINVDYSTICVCKN